MNHIESARAMTHLTYKRLCETMEVPYHRFRRWRNRVAGSLPALCVPGPKKTNPFDLAVLRGEIEGLSHGPKRTGGFGKLYGRYCFHLSRRDLGSLVDEVRQELRLERLRNMTRVEWLAPGMVWAVDGTDYCDPSVPKGAELLTTRDMGSKYLFKPLCTFWTPNGEEIGGYLSRLFWIHGAPLYLKIDCGSNLNSEAAMEALREYWVIPLISPPEYPQYNGSLEKTQGDIKGAIRQMLPMDRQVTPLEFELCGQLAAHDLNHQARRVLKGRTPCEVLTGGRNPVRLTIQERREIYDCVKDTCGSILSGIENPDKRAVATAWRKAAEWWLAKNGVIRLTRNGENVTLF